MINTAYGYDYVEGDLDRVVIDGDIMPLRLGDTGNVDANGNHIPRANILRGEDIAFLMEFANQRRFAVTSGTKVESGVTKVIGAMPRDLSSVGKSRFSRKLRTASGYTDDCSYFPHAAFADLAEATDLTRGSVLLFDEVSISSTFVKSCGTSVPVDSDIKAMIREKYNGDAFNTAGLVNPSNGGALLKQTVMDYFYRAASIANKGVGVMKVPTLYNMRITFDSADSTAADVLKYQRFVEKCDSSYVEDKDYLSASYIPNWGVCEWDFDGYDYPFPFFGHVYGHGFPPSGCSMLSIKAPHCDHAVAICAFVVFSYPDTDTVSQVYDCAILFKPYAMTNTDAQTYSLMSDTFASSESVDTIIAESGVTFPADTKYTHLKKAAIWLYAFPIVYFDDHTKW